MERGKRRGTTVIQYMYNSGYLLGGGGGVKPVNNTNTKKLVHHAKLI